MTARVAASEQRFILDHVAGFGRVTATEHFAETGRETVAAVLDEAARLADEVLAPLNRAGDLHPPVLEGGGLRTTPGYREGYRAIAEGGWIGLPAARRYGGAGLPRTLSTCVNELFAGACLALQLKPLLSQGQILALETHADERLRALCLPRLVSGDWSGTMDLTEAQAGSDVGAVRTAAEADADGSFRITGEKIFITWGESDLVANVCHLVLARLPGAAPGTRGLSLFLVPKRLPDAEGAPGEANSLRALRLEHKLGIHGAPTCTMRLDGARGWLVGTPHRGMAAMFTMMNEARLGVGMQGVGVAQAALAMAGSYAAVRVQGRTTGRDTGIIGHPDVRRMLAESAARVFAARAIGLSCAVAIDMAKATGGDGWRARAALLTPLAKVCGTETGIAVADMGIQVHGGAGYVEETGAAQLLRDVRITAIYEGTNGIQAIDLAGRKLDEYGAVLLAMIEETGTAARRSPLGALAEPVAEAATRLGAATARFRALGAEDRLAGALPWLRALALLFGAGAHLAAAEADAARLPLARVMIARLLPAHQGLMAAALSGAGDLFAAVPSSGGG